MTTAGSVDACCLMARHSLEDLKPIPAVALTRISCYSFRMISAALHPREDERIRLLDQLQILDSETEQAYDEIVALAAELAGTPIALVSLVDRHRQWFKARYGLDASETSREIAFCSHAILDQHEPLVVNDATKDERFHDNPLVTGAPDIRFYAGIPLVLPESDMPMGTLCVISDKVGELSESQLRALKILARQVERLLSLRQYSHELLDRNTQLEAATTAKSRFLTTLSHDIRTPMNGIIGSSEILKHESLPSEARKHVDTILACSQSLLHLINNILDLSKIEATGIELHPQPIDLANVCSEAIQVVKDKRATKAC